MHFQPLYKQKAKGSAAFIAPYRLQSLEGCNKVQVPKIIVSSSSWSLIRFCALEYVGLVETGSFFMQGWVRMDAYSFQKQSYSRRTVKKKIWQVTS